MPNPALAVDGHWELIDANGALAAVIESGPRRTCSNRP